MTVGGAASKGRPVLLDSDVERIIAAEKYLPSNKKDPFRLKPDNGHKRAVIDLNCSSYNLSMRIRVSEDDEFNFSILLVYTDPQNRDYILRRYNGDHGKHTNLLSGEVMCGPHIHKITEEYQRKTHKGEGYAEKTESYRTWNDAVKIFIKDMNIRYEVNKHISSLEEWVFK